ncbi:MAG: RES family NAD+ phosphorylase [Burkholderiaceae bacterium]
MIRDAELLDRLAGFPTQAFAGDVFRATRQSLDALAHSTSGGRWIPSGGAGVLCTSLAREGALAEICFHWAQWTPRPSKPASLHTLRVACQRTLRLMRVELRALGVNDSDYLAVNYERTRQIGDAVQFLECDGLIAPCAHWDCENLILFPDNLGAAAILEVVSTESVDWLQWATENGQIDD